MTAIAHKPHIWTRAEFEHLVGSGVLDPESRVELVDGEILDTPPQKSRHATAVQLIDDAVRAAFGRHCSVRARLPLAIDGYSEPEPDIAVVTGGPRDHRDAHPATALLIVEVADTSLAFDRTRKLALYARNAIPEYWILNLVDAVLEVHRDPTGDAYATRSVLAPAERIAPLQAPAQPAIAIADLIP
ncbi:MAG: Uma2 family endonuclease [Thiohalocapsa sp.]|uniref:Uma2 family endonuclease n=1 Tax=Thiohalocapsa sp. TaxID=2497641 RepID=UPI0025FF5235|nr:Uma2 family endonuclease [Thiohalocapsa sp.]MCG6941172.1 Uma2 family endonuclease [Thiohalocapsa sp.]